MTHENLEVVKRLLGAYESGDMETVFGLYHRDIDFRVGRLFERVGGPTDMEPAYRGHDGVRRFWRQWTEAWETISFTYDAFDLVGPIVVATLSQRVRARASGVELELQPYAQVWTVEDGLVVRSEFFDSPQEGQDAAIEALRERIAAAIEALVARDFDAPGLRDVIAEDTTFESALSAVEGNVHVGIEGLREWRKGMDAVWDPYDLEVLSVHPVPDGRVVVQFRIGGAARGSEIPIDAQTAQVWAFRGSRVARGRSFVRPEDAFALAGIEAPP